MNRREFLKGVVLGGVASGAPHLAKAQPKKHLLVQKSAINGMAYYDAESVIDQLSFDDDVHLRRESGNIHDYKAVAVYWGKAKLGYVPRISNFALAKMLDDGEKVTAIIAEIDPKRLPYAGIEIEITWESE